MRSHESKDFLGGVIASLSIPWGFNKGDEDLGGYHLVWPRDLVETAFGFLAAGAESDAVRILRYLEATQEADGRWAQNMWLDGRPYWSGMQMDETAFPILLMDVMRRHSRFVLGDPQRLWAAVSRAASFIVRNGPVTQQDRWEEDPGYSPFTLAVEISGLLAAADLADAVGQPEDGSPFDGTGIGRAWPLLAGERGHYELAAGRPQAAGELLKVMELSSEGGRLIPEQVWDSADIPAFELFRGKPSGSACPLV